MNTNLTEILLQILANQKPVHGLDYTLIAQVVIAFMAAGVVWLQKQAATTQKESALLIKQIDTNVNSERTRMIERLEAITGAFSDVSKELAVMKERQEVLERSKDAAEAAAKVMEELRKQEDAKKL